ncbi:MAG: lytic murein transglycosylase [Methylobacteriaceae bacterium]|nr:lytic murein transglycosylase [Methylobacteriaceae bacterium]
MAGTRVRTRIAAALALILPALGAAPALADFEGCLAGIRAQAASQGVPGAVFDRMMAGVAPDPKIIELMNNQPEFKTPIWDYLAVLVDDEKVAEGRAMMSRHASALAAAEQRFGVDRHAIAAVWGVESDFGKIAGRWSLPQSLSTLACTAPRRRDYFRGELLATLKIVARGDLAPEKLRGSWAGAFGQTQFMPSTYLRLAVDGDGDGRRDLVDSVADALHSTANFLDKAGWVSGATWGYEVIVPDAYSGPSGRSAKQPVSAWAARGITRADGSALTGSGSAGLLLPAGRGGPGFLVFKNYDAAYAYNGADSYALAISLLSDRLRGRGGLRGAWPTDDPGISRAERKELQRLLIARGYDVGEPDGAIGAKTRAAISDVQAKLGFRQDGRPGRKVLNALRGR